jgi:type II/III secretion system protein/VCBS repeat protein
MATRTYMLSARRAAGLAGTWARVALAPLVLLALLAPAARTQAPRQSSEPPPTSKSDTKKAKTAYEQGARAERQKDWETAYTAYTDASSWAPDNRQYVLHREIARSRLVQSKVDAAESDAVSGRLDAARKELVSASFVDPSNTVVRERLAELTAAELGEDRKPVVVELAGEPRLNYRPGRRNFDFRGNTQGAYEELGRQFGVEVAFDVDLRPRQIRFRADDVDFPAAVQLLGSLTGTFWRALTPRLFFVSENTPQKRKDYEASGVRTVLLPDSETPEQMTEMVRLLRDITGITRTELNVGSRTVTMRASPQAIALATDLIDDLERPTGELILEIEILEVDRNVARQLGITPPQSSQAFTLSTQQIQEAAASQEGLINVIEQVLGGSAPNVIAFGGGLTTYFATLPGTAANFSEMLSLVRRGRRVLLRTQDGRPATFFVGSRVPISLQSFDASLVNGSTTSSQTPIANPLTNYPAGNSPSFVTTSILRGNSTINDLIVANSADNTVSVLLGNGDGTFQTQIVNQLGASADKDPVWIATGAFNTTTNPNIDLAIANKLSNNVSILLGQSDSSGVANGTFVAGKDVTTGSHPVSVVAANFHTMPATGFLDLAVANQGDNTISILQGKGDGTFTAGTPIQLAAGFTPTALATGQFTNSSNVDLVVAEQSDVAGNAGQFQVLLGNGDGTFHEATGSPFLAGSVPAFVATGDFNGDGIPDLAVVNSGSPVGAVTGNSVSIFFGNADPAQPSAGNGSFTFQASYAAGNTPTSLAIADFNLDTHPDLVVSDSADNAVTVLFNNGTGVFSTLIPEIPVGTAPVSVVSADFNGDGRPDAAVADSGAAEVTVILNSANLIPTGIGSAGTLFPGSQYLDIGLKVKATPRIHPGNEVTLQLSFDISSLSAQSFNTIPVINSETVEQTVRLKQNESAAVAGFHQVQLSNDIVGNPGIADIPGLGLFDQNRNATQQDTDLLILVTPRMVRLAPRQDHVVYAGQGSLEGPGGGEAAPVFNPPPGVAPPPPVVAPPPAPGAGPTPAPAAPPAPQPQQ